MSSVEEKPPAPPPLTLSSGESSSPGNGGDAEPPPPSLLLSPDTNEFLRLERQLEDVGEEEDDDDEDKSLRKVSITSSTSAADLRVQQVCERKEFLFFSLSFCSNIVPDCRLGRKILLGFRGEKGWRFLTR